MRSRAPKSRPPGMPVRAAWPGRREPETGAPLRPGAGEIGMGQRFRFSGEQEHDAACQSMCRVSIGY